MPAPLTHAAAVALVARQAEMLGNRVAKTFKHLSGKFERRQIGAYRLYDRDIPEIRAVVDYYEGHLVVAEYARTQTDDLPDWLITLADAAGAAIGIPPAKVYTRTRKTRPKAGQRYDRLGASGERLTVREGTLKFLVNLDDFLDVGLYPDHRETRARVRAESSGKRVLNLYAYTGSFTCAAAQGGASGTTTVDVSREYLAWARDNLALNGLDGTDHRLMRADARAFLAEAARDRARWDLAIVDPPSFSDRGEGFDVQRDHRALIEEVLAVLSPGGVLYFSTNHQRFEPALEGLACRECREITAQTVPEDYRNKTVHRAFRVIKG